MIKKILIPAILFIAYISVPAQNVNISGQINKYTKVTSIEYCGNRITVDTPSLFTIGMQVLIIQMQGATIDLTNTSSYGNILNYNSAGNYEIQTIDSILGDTIKFRYQLARKYNVTGSVQLIPMPVYQSATVAGKLTCKAWEGNTGGVLLLKADTLRVNDTIDVSGKGFRGFYVNDSSQACFGNLQDYFKPDSFYGGIKGEGIIQFPNLYCRGKNANGGGGGNNENTGGGGGSNFGQGGIGGQIVYRTISCQGTAPGVGGAALAYADSSNKVFMAGGGGCGHGNNSEGTPGTNGGGICLIIANVVIGSGKPILANGVDQTRTAGSDGAGGAGGGGTVLLDVSQYAGALPVFAKGGKGGNLDNDYIVRSCMGPGGGGGGGVLWVSQAAVPVNITFTARGGFNGINLSNNSSFCPYAATNGALPGDSGGSVTGLAVPIPAAPYVRLSATSSPDTVLCNDQQLTLSAIGISSSALYYVWSTGQQTGSITFLASQTGPYDVTVSDDNTCTAVREINVKLFVVSPNFSPNTSFCSPQNITLSAQNPGNTGVVYAWSTGATTPTISFYADSTREYSVTVTSDSLPTCRATDTIKVVVGNVNVTFSHDTIACPGSPVVLAVYDTMTGSALSYQWSTGESTNSITVTTGSATTTYDVTVSAGVGCVTTHSFVITTDYLGTIPSHDTTICRNGTAILSVYVPNADSLRYHWSNGDITQQITVTNYYPQTYAVTVTSEQGCTGTASVRVDIDQTELYRIPGTDTTICPGGSATLTVNGSGIGLISYLWSTGQSSQTISVSPISSQLYTVTAADSLGCASADTIGVNTDSAATHLTLQITAEPDSALAPGDSIQLSVNGKGLMTYIWTPGQYLSDSSLQFPIATPLKGTEYCVAAIDSGHCIAEACIYVGVSVPPAQIAIPDAFTPNNDGKNDLYQIKAIDGTIVASMKIYDRWGTLLLDDVNQPGWDGSYKGDAQPAGTYSVYVTYYQKIYPEKMYYKTGTFNLFR